MIKISNQKTLCVTAIFIILLVVSAGASLVTVVHATEPSIQAKTLDVLSSVAGLNIQSYEISKASQLNNQYLSLPQEEAIINLVSNNSSLKAECSFVNDNLRLIYISEYKGAPSIKQQATSIMQMAQDFLGRYQAYTNDTFYSTLASMLSTTKENTNSTQINGNMKLDVSNFDKKIVDYTWTYIDSNGIEAASKNVILSYYNGQLQSFLNNWPLYKVVTNTSKISVKSATEIAVEASKNYSYEVATANGTSIVSGFKIVPESLKDQTLSYLNDPDKNYARGGDPFTLYPSWYVKLGFDKFYPGDVTGMTVTVWADTSQVSSMYQTICAQPTVDHDAPVAENLLLASVLIVPVLGIARLSMVGKRRVLNATTNRKLLSIPLTALLCLTIASGLASPSIPKANASLPNSMISKSLIYGVTNGSGLPITEAAAGIEVTNYIDDMTTGNGYSGTNLYGSQTYYTTVYSNIQSSQNFGQVATFYFGHFLEYHEAMQDNVWPPNGPNGIYASNIGQYTTGKDFFVWLWVCQMANLPTNDMPFYYTKNPTMSANGHTSPDQGFNCFMTFEGISPEIGNSTGTFENNALAFPNGRPGPLKDFIKKFYYYALSSSYQYTVHDALNRASIDFFGVNYENCHLTFYNDAYYPVDNTYHYGRMYIFGDSAIKLYQPTVYLYASGDNNNQLYPSFTINGVQGFETNSYRFMNAHIYQIGVPSNIGEYHFDHFYYNGGYYYNNPADICMCQDGTLQAYYVQDYINILSSDDGYTIPSAGYYRGSGSMQITAYPYEGDFSYWLLNDNYFTSDPTITVNYGANTLRPVFNPYAWLTVYTCDQAEYEVSANIYVDNVWIGCGYASTYLPLGPHTIYTDNWVWDEYYQQYVFPISSNWNGILTSDTDVTVYYTY